MSQVDVITEFILRTAAARGELSDYVADVIRQTEKISAAQPTINVKLAPLDTKALDDLLLELQTRAIEIPVRFIPEGAVNAATLAGSLTHQSQSAAGLPIGTSGSPVTGTTGAPGSAAGSGSAIVATSGNPVTTAANQAVSQSADPAMSRFRDSVTEATHEIEDFALYLARANEDLRNIAFGGGKGGGGGGGSGKGGGGSSPPSNPFDDEGGGDDETPGDSSMSRRQKIVGDRSEAKHARRDQRAANRRMERDATFKAYINDAAAGYNAGGTPYEVDTLPTDEEIEAAEAGTKSRRKSGGGRHRGRGMGFGRGQVGHILLSQISPQFAMGSYLAESAYEALGGAESLGAGTSIAAGGVAGLALAGTAIIADSAKSDFARSIGMSEAAYTGRVRGRAAQISAETTAAEAGIGFFGGKVGSLTRWAGFSNYTTESESRRDEAVQREADFAGRYGEADTRLEGESVAAQRDTVGGSDFVRTRVDVYQRRRQQDEANRRKLEEIRNSGQTESQKFDQTQAQVRAERERQLADDQEIGRSETDRVEGDQGIRLRGAGNTRDADVLRRESGLRNRMISASRSLREGKITQADYNNEQQSVEGERAADNQIYERQQTRLNAESGIGIGRTRREASAAGREANLTNDRQAQLQDRLDSLDDPVKQKQAQVDSLGQGTPERARAEKELTAETENANQQKIRETSEAKRRWALEDSQIISSTMQATLRASGNSYDADKEAFKESWKQKIDIEQDGNKKKQLERQRDAEDAARQYQMEAQTRQTNQATAVQQLNTSGATQEATQRGAANNFYEQARNAGLLDPKTGQVKDRSLLDQTQRDRLDSLTGEYNATLAEDKRQRDVGTRSLNRRAAQQESNLAGDKYGGQQRDIDAQEKEDLARVTDKTPEGDAQRAAISRDAAAKRETVARDRNDDIRGNQLERDQAQLRSEGRFQAAEVQGKVIDVAKEIRDASATKDPERLKSVIEKAKAQFDEQSLGSRKAEMFGSVADYANSRFISAANNDSSAYQELREASAALKSALDDPSKNLKKVAEMFTKKLNPL